MLQTCVTACACLNQHCKISVDICVQSGGWSDSWAAVEKAGMLKMRLRIWLLSFTVGAFPPQHPSLCLVNCLLVSFSIKRKGAPTDALTYHSDCSLCGTDAFSHIFHQAVWFISSCLPLYVLRLPLGGAKARHFQMPQIMARNCTWRLFGWVFS